MISTKKLWSYECNNNNNNNNKKYSNLKDREGTRCDRYLSINECVTGKENYRSKLAKSHQCAIVKRCSGCRIIV